LPVETHLQVVLGLFGGEGATVPDKVDKADGDAPVNIQNQIVLLAGGDRLDGKGIVQELVAWESLQDKLLDNLDTEIRVVSGLDLVSDTGNWQWHR
jgi:hypothetical protein